MSTINERVKMLRKSEKLNSNEKMTLRSEEHTSELQSRE